MTSPPDSSRRAGLALVVLGMLLLLGGVLYLLEASNGPGAGPRTFAERRSYDLVKRDLHAALPVGAPVALGGLGLVLLGKHLLDRGRPPAR